MGLQFIILLSLQLHRCLRCDSHVFRAYDSQSLPLKSLPTFPPGIYTPSLWATSGLPPNFGQPPAYPSIHILHTLSTNTCCPVRNLEGKTAMFECRSVAQCYILIWPKRIKQEQKKREWNSRNTTDTCQNADCWLFKSGNWGTKKGSSMKRKDIKYQTKVKHCFRPNHLWTLDPWHLWGAKNVAMSWG